MQFGVAAIVELAQCPGGTGSMYIPVLSRSQVIALGMWIDTQQFRLDKMVLDPLHDLLWYADRHVHVL
jgi:hypothetical protein